MRELVAETSLGASDLILPLFYADVNREIPSMPGVFQHDRDSMLRAVHDALDAGVRCVDVFGVPTDKDDIGSGAWDPEGILNRGLRALREEFGNDIMVMADTCLDEFTSHGHCGVVTEDGVVDNDATLPLDQKMAVAQAEAGAHIVSPSGMMDGQVAAIRHALDDAGYIDVAIMAYSAKYASAFYGPFRDAVGSSGNLKGGDKKTYQLDPANSDEGLQEVALDLDEGADMVMVKPGMPYLDLVYRVKQQFGVPTFAYQVSGEYAMHMAAIQNGWLKEKECIMESLLCFKRAGADGILTYFAKQVAEWLYLEGKNK